MSRISKYLKQTCVLEKYLEENNEPVRNSFGEYIYNSGITIPCRHELSSKDIQIADGSIVRSTSVYYVNESVSIKPDYRIDGSVVVSVISYVNALGRTEGFEVYV